MVNSSITLIMVSDADCNQLINREIQLLNTTEELCWQWQARTASLLQVIRASVHAIKQSLLISPRSIR